MAELMTRVEDIDNDIKPENYKDYKTLKANIKDEKDLTQSLNKEMRDISAKNQDQREKIAIYAERIRAMEEVVGMIADNDEYTNL